ncbi:hypothetical protein A9Q83_05030 [Alphaproteobacteria bacterium 46_93_T64]|nr:hypothetical protein A9Q83_05030 [Alphaproteobacteria bacterium 46_93_T64]
MRWNLTIFISIVVVAVSYGLYQLSYEVQSLEKDIYKIRAEILENQQATQILKAEWAYQNRPEIIQELTAKYLPLLLVAPYQVASLQDLPERRIDPTIANIFSVPIPRAKPRFKQRREDAMPEGHLRLATYRPLGSEE